MRKSNHVRWVWVLFVLTGAAFASPETDSRYAFKSLLPVVVNPEPENVHAQYVQTEIDKYFQTRPRFEVPSAGLQAFKSVKDAPAIGDLTKATPQDLAPWFAPLKAAGADSVLLVQVQKTDEEYRIAFLASLLEPTEIVFRTSLPVQDRFSLSSFGSATVDGLASFIQSLPYDATIINREGYRVVIDRGAPSFQSGSRIVAYTLETAPTGVVLKESGILQINRVDKNLSFATILVENKPLEVSKGQKVRFQTLGKIGDVSGLGERSLRPNVFSREVASVPDATTADEVFQKRYQALVDVQFVANVVSWNRTAASSGAYNSDTGFYPGANIRGEIALTKDFFADVGGTFAVSNLGTNATGSPTGLSSQYNQFRLLGGYRLQLNAAGSGPSFLVRAGYSRTQYQVDELPDVLASSSVTFSGFLVGGGIGFPFTEKLGVGLEMNALLLSSIAEGSAGTSGSSPQNIAGWDFSVRGTYRLRDKINFEGRLVFQTNSAGFTGTGTRTVPLASLSQTSRALMAGISYLF